MSTSNASNAEKDLIRVWVNGRPVEVPRFTPDWRGQPAPTTMMQACEAAGVAVPHFCYHRKLPVAGNCRMCLVEYGLPERGPDGQPVLNPDGSPRIVRSARPAIACATPVVPDMEIYTDTPTVRQMRQGVLEFLLINHPLDCPICDQAGECKLQEYTAEFARDRSRFAETKLHKPKAVELGPRVIYDAERCVLCTRCIRFTREIVGDDSLGIINRGARSMIAVYPGREFDNNYTLNTVDICPVGALTAKDFRFRMRVWFLKETPSICPGCGTGCNITIWSRQNVIYRLTPRPNDAVNSHWMCDTGRLNYKWISHPERITRPLIGGHPVPWPHLRTALVERLRSLPRGATAVVASARLGTEELWLASRLKSLVGAASDSIPRSGPGDHLLLNADLNPNTTGAIITGICHSEVGFHIPNIAHGIESGRIRALIVLGEDVTKHGLDAALLARLELLVACDVIHNATTRMAQFVIPGAAFAEKTGTFINAAQRIQRFHRAVDPPGEARPELETLAELISALDGRDQCADPVRVFEEMARDLPPLTGLSWATIGPTGAQIKM